MVILWHNYATLVEENRQYSVVKRNFRAFLAKFLTEESADNVSLFISLITGKLGDEYERIVELPKFSMFVWQYGFHFSRN